VKTSRLDAGCAEVGDDLAKPNTPIATTTKPMPSESSGMSKREARHARVDVGVDLAEQQAEQDHRDGLEQRARRQHHGADQAQHHQREVLGRPELEGEFGQRRREGRDDDRADAAGEERAQIRRSASAAPARPLRAIW
jgi:hypothetical protein